MYIYIFCITRYAKYIYAECGICILSIYKNYDMDNNQWKIRKIKIVANGNVQVYI